MTVIKKLKESLTKQLKNKGADNEHFLSLIDDYLWYWKQESKMQRDVVDRGRTYESMSAAGNLCEKENPSVKNALLYNKQKLAILKDLEINTSNVISDDDDEL